MRVTHGCIRLYPEDIERLYEMVPVGTPVRIVNQPVKVGRLGDRLYLEVHPPFTDLGPAAVEDEHLTRTVHAVAEVLDALPEHEADWEAIQDVGLLANGVPVVVNRLRFARGR
jgi:L,D-transpeptidase ErfK/SrfK